MILICLSIFSPHLIACLFSDFSNNNPNNNFRFYIIFVCVSFEEIALNGHSSNGDVTRRRRHQKEQRRRLLENRTIS